MRILESTISIEDLKKISADTFGDLVKAVVDVKRGIVALDAELHADLEALLLENGSKQQDLWGINFYPDVEDEDFVEFDSMINMRPSQGNMSRGVVDEKVQKCIVEIVNKWIRR